MSVQQALAYWKGEPLSIESLDVCRQNATLLSTYLWCPQRGSEINCVSLVDSGCTGKAFIDRTFAEKACLWLHQLDKARPLHLADGGFKEWVEHYVETTMRIGCHKETIRLFVADLAQEHPIILGWPWLQLHNPDVNWVTNKVTWNKGCVGSCIDRAKVMKTAAMPLPEPELPTPEPEPPIPTPEPTVDSPPEEEERRVAKAMKRRSIINSKKPQPSVADWASIYLTEAPEGSQAMMMEAPSWPAAAEDFEEPFGPDRKPSKVRAIVEVRGGRRVWTMARPERIGHAYSHRFDAAGLEMGPLDLKDFKIVNAETFTLTSKMRGVHISATTWAELQAAQKEKQRVAMPTLSEDAWREIMQGNGEPYKKFFENPEVHEFIDVCKAEAAGERVSATSFRLGETPRSFVNRVCNLDEAEEPAKLEEERKPTPLTDIDRICGITEEDVQKFMEKSTRPKYTPEEVKARFLDEYKDLSHVANPRDADIIPEHRSYDHKIELIPGNELPYSRARPMSPQELRVIKQWLDDNLAKGFIRPSTSDVASPVLLARKPGGGVRICVDYRGINNISLKNRYPLPLIKETLDAICKAKWFTKVDVIAAFNRLRMAEGHEWLTAFITRFGLYESLVCPFGLSGAPASFQNFINDVLYDILDVYATAYLDDVLIFSETYEDHIKHVREVLQRLIDAGLQIDIDKCEFHTQRTKYLGLIITPGGIEMDQEKVEAVTHWEAPTSRRQLQRFLGFANFYRRFIAKFSSMAKPLYELTKKTVEWQWEDRHNRAFEALKAAFTTAPVLKIYDWEKPTVVEVDASDWSSGGTLSQMHDDGELYPVAYFSAKHTAAECNYDIYDKELLAVVKALEEWRPELEGAVQPFEIITDHKNLKTFGTTKKLTPRHMRWSEFLSRFNFTIKYRPGSTNVRPDALSRKPEHVPRDMTDDRLQARKKPLIDPSRFDESFGDIMDTEGEGGEFYVNVMSDTGEPLVICTLEGEGEGYDSEDGEDTGTDTGIHTDDLILRSYSNSSMIADITMAIKNGSRWPKHLKKVMRIPFAECYLVNDRAIFRDRVIVPPDDEKTQLELIHRTHASAPGGHPGRDKTLNMMNRTYWWPGLTTAVNTYCKGCLSCSKTKPSRTAPAGFLKPLPLPNAPWRDISVDYVTPLPKSRRGGKGPAYQHVAVVVDRLTKMRHFIPCEGLTTEELVEKFIDRIYTLHGLPDTIVSDRGVQFVSTFWKQLSDRLGVTLKLSTPYHKQTNGQTERINAEMEQYLRTFVNWAQDDWVDWLALAEFQGNNLQSATTGVSPFFANYGFHPRMGTEPTRPPPPDVSPEQRKQIFKANEIVERFKTVWDKLIALSRQAQDRYEAAANVKRTDAPKYKPGDMVMLNMENYATGRPTAKLSPRFEGPFRVMKADSHSLELSLPTNMKVTHIVNVSRVKPYEEGLPGQAGLATDVKANEGMVVTRTDDFVEERRWEFEALLDYQKVEGNWCYQVKWTHHPPDWQPAANLEGCDELVWKLHDSRPELGLPHPIFRKGFKTWQKAKDKAPAESSQASPGLPSPAPAPDRPVRRSARLNNK